MRKILMLMAISLAALTFIGCGGSSGDVGDLGDDSDSGGGDNSTTADSDIQFDISDAVAILKVDSVSADVSAQLTSNSGNLRKLTADGAVENVFSGGTVNAESLYIAPDGKIYVLLSSVVDVNGKPCILLRLSDDNNGECLDSDLRVISHPSLDNFPTEPIQFDDDGNIYYVGTTWGGTQVLRMLDPESLDPVDLINDNIIIRHFLVHNDGTVYLAGMTVPTETTFFRRILPDGDIEVLLNGGHVSSLFELPDGNVYAGEWGEKYAVMKITDEGVEDKLFIGYTSVNGEPLDADFYVDDNEYDSCSLENWLDNEGFCEMGGTRISFYHRTPDDDYYVVAGSGDAARLWQYWPTVQPIDTSVDRPTVVKGSLTSLIIAGYDESNNNKLIAYNTADQSEIDLLEDDDIEIYHFNYSSDTGLITFDGLRFSDNTHIVGSIDTDNGNELTVLESGIQYDDMKFVN